MAWEQPEENSPTPVGEFNAYTNVLDHMIAIATHDQDQMVRWKVIREDTTDTVWLTKVKPTIEHGAITFKPYSTDFLPDGTFDKRCHHTLIFPWGVGCKLMVESWSPESLLASNGEVEVTKEITIL